MYDKMRIGQNDGLNRSLCNDTYHHYLENRSIHTIDSTTVAG